uniref:Apple domain-containing protein n=1 Tax=Syphacia muris TaxID=451379 RepID=A0A0N5AVJ2_9BILA
MYERNISAQCHPQLTFSARVKDLPYFSSIVKEEKVWKNRKCCGEYTSSYRIYAPNECKEICNAECVGYAVTKKSSEYYCTVFETLTGVKIDDASECHYFPYKDNKSLVFEGSGEDIPDGTVNGECFWPDD